MRDMFISLMCLVIQYLLSNGDKIRIFYYDLSIEVKGSAGETGSDFCLPLLSFFMFDAFMADMKGAVRFAIDKKKEKYLTRMEKEELREIRHGRMTKIERFRECSASFLKVILLFGAPVILSLVMLFIIITIYIVRPYALTKDFTRTMCEVTGHAVINETMASCSAGTDPFQPCVKVMVSYAITSGHIYKDGVIMENEQALVNCNPCSYTFGRHGMFHQYQDDCQSWKEDFAPTPCVQMFLLKHARKGDLYPCYFNPRDPMQVVKDLVIDVNSVIHGVSWPILICMIYLLSWGFVCYDSKQGKMIDEVIREETEYQQRIRHAEKIHSSKWKKQRLGETLGVRQENSMRGSFLHRSLKDMSHMSASLPSLTDFSQSQTAVRHSNFTESTDDLDNGDENGDIDLRHLDLAVSQQNINDLSESFPYMETPPPLTYENVTAAFGTRAEVHPIGLSLSPHSPMSAFRRHTKPVLSTHSFFNHGSSSFSVADRHRIDIKKKHVGSNSLNPMSNGSFFYQQPHPDASVSEDEIDGYYTVGQGKHKSKQNETMC